ncbi:hypothetical protein TNCT_216941 [Trichonephila clavata]|uniref:Uncharacterized protein n=1 Tax=Trichonephila clavata TaxID=2740835 RepID=A0A8X6HVH6_TRICU|nr:hypothetical protein TNCT_216941 [Trichonephila clavata]
MLTTIKTNNAIVQMFPDDWSEAKLIGFRRDPHFNSAEVVTLTVVSSYSLERAIAVFLDRLETHRSLLLQYPPSIIHNSLVIFCLEKESIKSLRTDFRHVFF